MALKRKSADYSDIGVACKYSRIDEAIARGNNALMMLNEVGIKNLKWNFEQKVNIYPQQFEATCQFTQLFSAKSRIIPAGYTFFAQGSSKANCKHELANQIIEYLTSNNDNDMQRSDVNKVILDISSEAVGPIPNSSSNESLCQAHNESTIEDSVRILNEKVKDIDYKFHLREDGYICNASIHGFLFKGLGSSKKIAKRNVAVQAMRKLFKFRFSEEKPQKSIADIDPEKKMMEKIIPSRQKKFSNLVEVLIKTGYEGMISNLEMQYTRRKVLAGIVMTRKLESVFPEYSNSNKARLIDPQTGWNLNPDDNKEIIKVISIATGTKCISGDKLSTDGNVLQDCHAEVVAKRGLQLFIYKTIKQYQIHQSTKSQNLQSSDTPGTCAVDKMLYGCDIFTYTNDDNKFCYSLNPDVQFHLYISSAPCGDSRIFPQSPAGTLMNSMDDILMNEDLYNGNDSHPNRKNRGLLRTKIERGEGTIPLKETHIQTWDGILGGERLRTMSCSDKVCLWNVVGLQGALLSNMLDKPIYLSSVIVGSIFQYDHLQRALFERANGVEETDEWLGQIDKSPVKIQVLSNQNDVVDNNTRTSEFFLHRPFVLTVTNQEERNPTKASNYSFNWIVNDDSVEIVHTVTGVTIDNARSRLCKRNLFKQFLSVFEWMKSSHNSSSNLSDSYYYDECKSMKSTPLNSIGSIQYIRKKISLFKYFDCEILNLGRWLSKPHEVDQFGLSSQYIGSMLTNVNQNQPIESGRKIGQSVKKDQCHSSSSSVQDIVDLDSYDDMMDDDN